MKHKFSVMLLEAGDLWQGLVGKGTLRKQAQLRECTGEGGTISKTGRGVPVTKLKTSRNKRIMGR